MSYFIPEIAVINGEQIPSTPFNLNQGKPILMGDVFEVSFEPGAVQTFVTSMKDGQYIGLSANPNIDVPLYLLGAENVKVLGNRHENPALIEKLTT